MESKSPVADFPLPGRTYIVLEEGRDTAFKLVKQYKEEVEDSNALIFTRTEPKIFKEDYDLDNILKDSEVTWIDSSKDYSPSHLLNDIKNSQKNTIIMLDGISYIAQKTSFGTAYGTFTYLTDHVAKDMDNNLTLIVNIHPDTFGKKELALLCERNEVVEKREK